MSRKDVHCTSNVVRKANDHLPSGSKIIDLIVCNHAIWRRENAASAKATEDGMPNGFYEGLVDGILATETAKNRQALRADACHFHDHASKVEEASCAAMFKEREEEVKWRKRKRQLEQEVDEQNKRIRLHSESFHQVAKSTKGANVHKLKVDD